MATVRSLGQLKPDCTALYYDRVVHWHAERTGIMYESLTIDELNALQSMLYDGTQAAGPGRRLAAATPGGDQARGGSAAIQTRTAARAGPSGKIRYLGFHCCGP